MLHAYGKAVVEERTTPARHREIAAYLRREYDPGTGPGYLLAAVSDATALRRATPRESGRAVRALVTSVQGLVPWMGTQALEVEGGFTPEPAKRTPERGAREPYRRD